MKNTIEIICFVLGAILVLLNYKKVCSLMEENRFTEKPINEQIKDDIIFLYYKRNLFGKIISTLALIVLSPTYIGVLVIWALFKLPEFIWELGDEKDDDKKD